ncbi:MAG: hypothetical protein Q4D26_00230 [Clostridia bacterium]|nr:hypothetical protein [Clostridia bacterium]
MNKKIFILFFLIILFACVMIINVNYKENKTSNQNISYENEINEDYINEINQKCNVFISDEELAEEYGYLLLKKGFSDYLKNSNVELKAVRMDALGYDNVWKVFTVISSKKSFLFDSNTVELGGSIFVMFKSDGSIIEFGFGV